MSDDWTTVDTSKPEKEEEKVQFEIEGEEETSAPVETESSAPSSYEEPEQSTEPEQKTEEEDQPQSGAQKRIRQLVKQKKERDEQIQALMSRQAELEERLKEQQKELRSSLEKSFESAEEQIKSRIAMAQDAYRQALDSGDTDRIVKTQELLSNAQSDATSLKFTKQQLPEEVEQPQQKEVAAQPQYDKHAVTWAGKNPWFGQDNVMTTLALEVDAELKAEGYDPSEEEFYEEIDARLKAKFPQRFGNQAVAQEERMQETSTPAQVVGGASRTSPASSGTVSYTHLTLPTKA